ncbi:hypothetical protein E0M91_05400 [Escherichia coli]|uniref:hypothetical protein n=1 Tax=Escherichia coli TaxID=562 RepID=UPI000450BDFA|nr:hypothetical protein [Escherichia coli]EFN6769882.1 hypothetical protein [Escherichia coli O39:H21]EEC8394022.1 hypothetical protein [Escherichia coli]EEQ7772946.1 hypothetical protein [Escherichia coli]EER5744633.1 hypothetical protein [Escherichia coli]EER8372399.1 hypothetical protein [Escherichia coli]
MKGRTIADYAKLAQESAKRNVLRTEFSEYLKVNGLERSEENAHTFAFGKTNNHDDRVNLVHMLMSGVWGG